MTPIIAIVGRSKSGKTALIERLIPEFIKRGYRVATVKHHGNDFQIDHEGKDSWRHKAAGAHTVVISSPRKIALIEDSPHDLSLEELATRFVRGADIIIAEGFKRDIHPKVEVFRKEIHPHPLAPDLENVIAVVSDDPSPVAFRSLRHDDIRGIADTIEEQVIAPLKGIRKKRHKKTLP